MPKYNANKHHRRSIRLKDHDYSHQGGYFVTICTHQHRCLFGDIASGDGANGGANGGAVVLNGCGKIVEEEWLRTRQIRKEIEIDLFVIMPNHFHAIVFIINDNDIATPSEHGRGAQPCAPTQEQPPRLYRPPRSLGSLIAGFKSITTKRINQLHETPGHPVWQRNYYETILRSEGMLNSRRQYILGNPGRWAEDDYYPGIMKDGTQCRD